MARVESPNFCNNGEVNCCDCPIDTSNEISPCLDWLKVHNYKCPTSETYDESCKLAEQEASK